LFAQTPFDKDLGVSNLDWLRYEIIWEKTSATGHLNAKKMPLKAHENILVNLMAFVLDEVLLFACHLEKLGHF
jgi:hypothetical protein